MKKMISLLLVVTILLAFSACGDKKVIIEMAQDDTEAAMKRLTESALDVDFSSLYVNTMLNKEKAEELYCGEPIRIAGVVMEMEDAYVVLGCDDNHGQFAEFVIDAYIPTDHFALLEPNQKIVVVGINSGIDFLIDTSSGVNVQRYHYIMSEAYVVSDTIEIDCTIHDIDAEANICTVKDRAYKEFDVYFDDSVDLSQYSVRKSIRVSGKVIYLSDDDFEVREAVIVG